MKLRYWAMCLILAALAPQIKSSITYATELHAEDRKIESILAMLSTPHCRSPGMNLNKRIEIQIWKAEHNRPKTQTATQAFCRACNKGVALPHKCPDDGTVWVEITRRSVGL